MTITFLVSWNIARRGGVGGAFTSGVVGNGRAGEGGRRNGGSFAIVGAGTTGVELAGELRQAVATLPAFTSLLSVHQLSIVLIEMADRLSPGASVETAARAHQALERGDVELKFQAGRRRGALNTAGPAARAA